MDLSIAAILALFWSGAVALAHSLAAWAAGAAGTADTQALAALLRDWPLPSWLAWVDPATLESLRMALSAVGASLVLGQPWVASAMGWIGPVLWLVWVLGIALLLALASIAHLLIHRWAPRPALIDAGAAYR